MLSSESANRYGELRVIMSPSRSGEAFQFRPYLDEASHYHCLLHCVELVRTFSYAAQYNTHWNAVYVPNAVGWGSIGADTRRRTIRGSKCGARLGHWSVCNRISFCNLSRFYLRARMAFAGYVPNLEPLITGHLLSNNSQLIMYGYMSFCNSAGSQRPGSLLWPRGFHSVHSPKGFGFCFRFLGTSVRQARSASRAFQARATGDWRKRFMRSSSATYSKNVLLN